MTIDQLQEIQRRNAGKECVEHGRFYAPVLTENGQPIRDDATGSMVYGCSNCGGILPTGHGKP